MTAYPPPQFPQPRPSRPSINKRLLAAWLAAGAILPLAGAMVCDYAPIVMHGTAPSWAHLCAMVRNSALAYGNSRVGNTPTCHEAQALTNFGILFWVATVGLAVAALVVFVISASEKRPAIS